MKRIYMTLALIGALVAETKAQSIDLEAVIALPTEGQLVGPHQTLDTDKVLCGVIYNGPDEILAGDALFFMTSFSKPGTTPGTFYLDGVQYSSDITSADSGSVIFVFPNANEIGRGHTAPFKLASDSLTFLIDWNLYSTQDSLVAVAPPYVNGKNYGFYFRAVKVSADGVDVSDPVTGNNTAIQKITWNSATAIQEFAQKEKAEINLYPNPATNVVGFDFNYAAPTHSTVLIRDINGRIVYSKNYGWSGSGIQHYAVDISKLSTGNYVLELDSDNQHATSKFSKK